MPARFVNCLIKAVNDATKLPHFVVVVPDLDLLEYLNHYSYGVEEVGDMLVTWVITKMKEAVNDKKDQLFKIKPGAIRNTELKFVWVKMLKRMRSSDKIFTVCSKYNDMLEKQLANHKQHYVIDPNPKLHRYVFYSKINILNEDGKSAFWRELDGCIKMFENEGLWLKPRKDLQDTPTDSTAAIRYKLPSIPPRPKSSLANSSYGYKLQKTHHDRNNSSRFHSYNKVWVNKNYLK